MSQPTMFNPQCLSPNLSKYCNDISKKTQIDIAATVLSVLVETSACAQDVYDIKMPDGQIMPIGLIGIYIAESGEGKSALLNLTNRARLEADKHWAAKYKKSLESYTFNETTWKMAEKEMTKVMRSYLRQGRPIDEIKQALSEHQTQRPKKPRLIKRSYSNFTPEAFIRGLSENWPHATISTDEASMFFNGRGSRDLTLLNHAWDGRSIAQDRCSDDATAYVENPRVAGLLCIQPKMFEKYLARHLEEARSIGFCARTLICQPLSRQGSRSFAHVSFESKQLPFLYEQFNQFLEKGVDINGEPIKKQILYFSPEAIDALARFSATIEKNIAPGAFLSNAKDFASKLQRHVARIAANVHLLEQDGNEITDSFVEIAIHISKYFAGEFIRLLTVPIETPKIQLDAQALHQWLHRFVIKNNNRYIMKSDILKLVTPVHLRKNELLMPVIHELNQTKQIGLWTSEGIHYIDMSPQLLQDQFLLKSAIDRHRFRRKKKPTFAFVH